MSEKRGLNGAVLKWIALVSMLLDHIGYALVARGYFAVHRFLRGDPVYAFYVLLRSVGRLAFPIFCFLLAEGFLRTRSRGRYLLRLLLFALISEIPFDLAFNGAVLEAGSQNVFFTLALGLLAVWAWQTAAGEDVRALTVPRALAALGATALCMSAAHFGETDYGMYGVLLILAFYLPRKKPWLRDLCVALVLGALVVLGGSWWIELFAISALAPVHAYNGERGKQAKYFFYIFYPAHLLLLAGIRYLVWGI